MGKQFVSLLDPVEREAMRDHGRKKVGLACAAAHEHWLYALCVIAWQLNGREQVKHIGRRRLIARVRGEQLPAVSM